MLKEIMKKKINNLKNNDDFWEVVNLIAFTLPIVLGIFFAS